MPLNQEGVPYWSSIHFRLGPSPSCFVWTNGAKSKDVRLLLSSLLSEDRPFSHMRGSITFETYSLSGFTVAEKVMVILVFLFKKVLNYKVALYFCSIEWWKLLLAWITLSEFESFFVPWEIQKLSWGSLLLTFFSPAMHLASISSTRRWKIGSIDSAQWCWEKKKEEQMWLAGCLANNTYFVLKLTNE